jgi:hypothetical protein
MSVDNTAPNPLEALVPKPLNESSHDNPELHFIGSALLRPSSVSSVVPGQAGSPGVLPGPAREDHVHGMSGTGSAPPLSMDDVVAGILDVQYGGTGQSTLPVNAYVKGNGTAPVLSQAAPIPVVDGGTGSTFFAAGQVLVGNGTNPVTTMPVSGVGVPTRSGFALRRVGPMTVNSGVSTLILWDTEDEDSGGWFSSGGNLIVPAGVSGVLICRSVLKIQGVFGFGSGTTAHHTIGIANEYHMVPIQNSTVYNDNVNSWSSVSAGPIQVGQGNAFGVTLRHDSGAARTVTGSFRGWIIVP